MIAGAAQAAYMDPGLVATSSENLEQAKASWETAEYQKDWGLSAMNASTAYALGYHGQGVAVGEMDSGALLQLHPELAGDRFHASHASGTYGTTGNRYQTGVSGIGDVFGNGDYTEGEQFETDGNWVGHVNDTHGTHVAGTIGANRDGSEFHGVAWGSDLYVGNTGGTDNTNYGLNQDYNYFYAAWKGVADDLIAANGAERGGVINNSFGTNLRTGTTSDTSLVTNTTAQTEYEYFLFRQRTAEGARNFVDAAYDAVRGTNVVQVMTTGNRNMDMPYYRALYPYFNPEAEQHWIAVAGLQKDGQDAEGRDKYRWYDDFNQAGNAKWWTVVAPGDDIYSSIVYDDHYERTSEEHPLGTPGYASYGGTSMAAPHVTGAMGVLMSRYQDMSAIQVRDVLFTTASHTNKDGSTLTGWTVQDGQVDPIYGWGLPDLDKGMHGLGQLLGTFTYDMKSTALDVWSNNISQTALDQRKAEDSAWMTLTDNGTNLDAESYELGKDGIPNVADSSIDQADARAWRAEYYALRAAAIQAKLDGGLYDGKLVKQGAGMLVMTGNNTYRGGTVVEDGTLIGFAESFGVTGENAQATANGQVTVNGGAFGVINSYDDQFTKKGLIQSEVSPNHSVDVTVNAGGTYLVSGGEDVSIGNLDLQAGSAVSVWTDDTDALVSAYTDGTAITGTVTAATLTGEAVAKSHLAFFDATATTDGNTLTATLERKQGGMAAAASTANGRAIGAAIEANPESEFFRNFIGATATEAQNTFGTLGSDELLNASTASIMNTVTLTRAVQEQAQGTGNGRFVEMADGTARLWATGIGSWGDVDFGQSSIDNDFYAGLFGAEVDVCPAAKIGVFFGAGTTETKGDGKLESDDIHFGAYAVSHVPDVAAFNFGFLYTKQDREGRRALTVGSDTAVNAIASDADIAQIFAEAAYTGFNTDVYSVEPYVGFSWMHVTADDFSETVGTQTFRTENENQNLQMTTLGVRGALPFTVGSMAFSVKGDLSWMHFFGDTSPEASLKLADAGTAVIEGGELDNLVGVSLGVEANLTKSTTFGLSYTGAYNGDVNTSGLYANVRFAF